MHKTGTTAIQESLHLNRAWLAEHGVAYPQIGLPGKRPHKAHHDFAMGVASGESASDPAFQHCCREIERAGRTAQLTVLSAEPIYRLALDRHLLEPDNFFKARLVYLQRLMGVRKKKASIYDAHRAYLKRLRKRLRAFDVSVLVYFRRPDSAAESLYKNGVAKGSTTSPFSMNLKWMERYFDYPRRIDLFRDVFDRVEARCYETETKNGLLAGFYAALGLEEPPVKLAGKVRHSHNNRATLWLCRARAEDSRIRVHRNRALFAAENAGIPVFAESEPSTLWPSDEAFTAFVERNRPAYEMGYFDPPEPPGRPTTLWTDEMHTSAEEAFADWLRANAERLDRRAAAGQTKHWDPDPDPAA
jgi:hypothetical protein